MAATTEAILVPLDKYLTTAYRPDRDWIDGELRERNMGEAPHSAVQKFLITYLSAREDEWGVTVWPEQRLQTSPTRFCIPDICITLDSAPYERIFRAAPLLCIEVMNYDDRRADILERAQGYLAMGVETVWIIDPRRRTASITTHTGTSEATHLLKVSGTQISVPIAAVFAYLDKMESRQ